MNILVADFGIPFNLRTPYMNPLGGSEISALLLSKGLAEYGESVVLLTTENTSREIDRNLVRDNVQNFVGYADQSDVIILNRFIPPVITRYFDSNKKLYVYMHDNWDQNNVSWLMNKNTHNKFKLLCVSNYQKNMFIDYFGRDENEFLVIGNPIDPNIYNGNVTYNRNKLVFASIPYKGINVLKDIFDAVCIKMESDDLYLDVYSSMKLYGDKNDDKQYEKKFRDLANTKNVNIHNPVSMVELANVFSESSILLSPSTYSETFGRVYVEAMMNGCIPISVNNGASYEVIENKNLVTNGCNIYNKQTFDEFINIIVGTLKLRDEEYKKLKLSLPYTAKKWNYMKVAKSVLNDIHRG